MAAAERNDVASLTFAAAAPDSYTHTSGGGAFGTSDGASVTALNGSDFVCGDTVSFFNVIEMGATASGAQTIEMTNVFSADADAASGVGFTEIMNIVIDPADPAQSSDAGSQIGVVGFGVDETGTEPLTDTGDVLSGSDNTLFATYVIDDLEANETVVVRTDALLECDAGATPQGQLLASLSRAGIVADGSGGVDFDEISGTGQLISLTNVDAIGPAGTAQTAATGPDTAAAQVEADTADPPPEELPLTGDGSDLAAVAALATIGVGLVVLGTSYRRSART